MKFVKQICDTTLCSRGYSVGDDVHFEVRYLCVRSFLQQMFISDYTYVVNAFSLLFMASDEPKKEFTLILKITFGKNNTWTPGCTHFPFSLKGSNATWLNILGYST